LKIYEKQSRTTEKKVFPEATAQTVAFFKLLTLSLPRRYPINKGAILPFLSAFPFSLSFNRFAEVNAPTATKND
jgi:hypothetical protein